MDYSHLNSVTKKQQNTFNQLIISLQCVVNDIATQLIALGFIDGHVDNIRQPYQNRRGIGYRQ